MTKERLKYTSPTLEELPLLTPMNLLVNLSADVTFEELDEMGADYFESIIPGSI